MSHIAGALARIRERIVAAARAAGRDPDGVRLVAVSKGQPAEAVRAAYAAGQRAFGENYAQELGAKAAACADLDVEWHFIGHLQRNKVKDVLRAARTIETLDRPELAAEIAKRASAPVEVMIEVNVGGEAQKSGCRPEDVAALVGVVRASERLVLAGLMAVPPLGDDPEAARPFFARLRRIAEEARRGGADPGPGLSMGMSADFEVAIAEGATLVRVGTAIFGARPPRET